ncbi:MAG: SDR family NAD(P)-dependent oxidoreductase [Bacteroidota bacterium]|nr:SDR family NAD(P)-dependent oxidoreductase [Bacteroidota bacterium]
MSKKIIVTGAAGNLGLAVVKKFIAEGQMVIGTVTSGAFDRLAFTNENFEQVIVDLTNEESAQKFVTDCIVKYGNIDTAVLTVGGFTMGKIAETKTSDINKQYQLNFETAYNVARPVFIQMLKQKKGRIFLIGSRPGIDAAKGKGMIAYSLSKSLIFHLSELMNHEAKGTDVVTNVIVPSTIDTPQNRHAMPAADFSSWVTPEKIAGIINYYCGDDAGALRESVIKIYNNS